MGLRIVAIDAKTGELTFSDPEYCDGDEYVSGETLAEFGVENISIEERKTVAGLDAACAAVEATAQASEETPSDVSVNVTSPMTSAPASDPSPSI